MARDYQSIAEHFMVELEMPCLYSNGILYTHEGTHYRERSKDWLAVEIRRWTQAKGEELRSRDVAEVIASLFAVVRVRDERHPPFWLGDGPPAREIIPFRNGLYHLGTGKLQEHTHEFVGGWCLPYDHNPEATCPEWIRVLGEVYEGDQDRIGLLQEWFGYCLTSDTSQHKMLGLTGVQRSLKSTILGVLRQVVGEDNVAACRMSSLATRFGLQPLVGKPLAIISEVELEAGDSAGIVESIKSITGEDLLLVDRKGVPAISTKLPTRLTFATNRMPLLFDGSAALADRLLLIEHRVSWLGREDRELPLRLADELEGIAVWALEGLRRLRERGRFAGVDSDTMTAFRRASASVDAFLTECCVVHPDYAPAYLDVQTTTERVEIARQGLYEAYFDWCERWDVYGRSEKSFHGDLADRMPRLRKDVFKPHGKARRYRGISLQPGCN